MQYDNHITGALQGFIFNNRIAPSSKTSKLN